MFSFRSIFIAAAAFATMASAIPAPASPVPGISNLSNALGNLPANIGSTPNLGGNVVPGATSKRGGNGSPGDVFQKCHDGIAVIVVKIGDAVHCEGGPSKVDVKLVISLLGEIVILLEVLLKELKLIIVAELTLNGVACTLADLAKVVAGLLILVVEVVYLVLSIVGSLNVTLNGVFVVIGGLLCEILTLVLTLVVGLKVEVAVLLKVLVGKCGAFGYGKILAIVGIYI